MPQTQTKNLFSRPGRMREYTPVADVFAGDIVIIGSNAFLAANDIAGGISSVLLANGTLLRGALHADGEWTLNRDASTFADGDPVYWNATGNPNVGTAGTGCATSTASGNTLVGQAVIPDGVADVNTNQYISVLANVSKNTNTIGGAITGVSFTSTASTFPIAGQNAAQGGSVSITGGTSSTGGNAGGAVSMVGGTPGATGIGGAVSITGGAGGSTSGAGGAVSMVGGAGTASNSAGGAASVTGGAGIGSSAGGAGSLIGGAGGATGTGGAITITSGAGGSSSGAAGAINISVGSATSGAGAAITITGGAGAGGTSAGGNVNLVGGNAVSTGVPGEVQVNGNSGLMHISEALTATDVTRTIFVATRACRLKAVSVVWTTGSSSGTLQLEKCTGTTAPGSGTVLLTGTVSLSGTANTTQNGTLIATVASLTLAAGDRLGIVIAGTMTSLAGCRMTMAIAPA